PPPKNNLKLNVDAHSLSDGHWGLGLILRKDDGRCLGAATRVRLGTDCVVLAEALGVQEALKFIKQHHLHNVIIETDSEILARAIRRRSSPRTAWGRVVRECVDFLDTNSDISVCWVKRDDGFSIGPSIYLFHPSSVKKHAFFSALGGERDTRGLLRNHQERWQ
ncbi:ribonuclease H protein, partial [Trifolium medium]|nr:ribonuclease H protein [Trifolium medium]